MPVSSTDEITEEAGAQAQVSGRDAILSAIQFDKDPAGLVPAVIQDPDTKDVLMLGFMNREALAKTLDTGMVTFWTRSRGKLWTKGETSGNILKFESVRVNCNDDSLLIFARPAGPTCHTGHPTCYFREGMTRTALGRRLPKRNLIRMRFMAGSSPAAAPSVTLRSVPPSLKGSSDAWQSL